MEANKRGFKGVWLCAAIYESQELSAVEKLLLAEIDALTTEADACYATNAHFSDRLGVTVTRVDHLLGKLTRLGYIVRVSFDGRVTRRVVAISRFFSTEASIYVDPSTGAHLSRRGGFIGWRKVIGHLRDGDYGIMDAVCNGWFVARPSRPAMQQRFLSVATGV